MKTLDLYIIRRVLAPFSLALAVLLMTLSLERLLRLVKITSEQKAPAFKTFELLAYLLPHYLGLALPAALFLGILLAMRRLQEDSELTIIQSAGISPRHLYKALSLIIIPATLLMLCLSCYIQPHARHTYRAALHGLVAENPLANLRPGIFLEISENTVLRAEYISREDGTLENVFISRKKSNPPQHLLIGAEKARISRNDDETRPVLILENGNLIQENLNRNKNSRLTFQSYPWPLPGTLGEPYGLRGQDEREMTPRELLTGGVKNVGHETPPARLKAEFHTRLVQALSLPFFALWALPLALIGAGRTGKAGGIILAAALFVLYEKIIGLGEAYAANGTAQIWLALWTPFAALGLSGWLFMHYKIPEKLKTTETTL
ncbi:MAG: LptF/LptG family permease [Alphaproteobacteria bacterium]